jgi:hypothetical protein
VRLQEIAPVRASLEQAFMELTATAAEFRGDARGSAGTDRRVF